MSFSCSQCNFTSQFSSALTMHRQLEHNITIEDNNITKDVTTDENLIIDNIVDKQYNRKISCLNKNAVPIKGLSRTNSATRLFEKLRTKLCRSKAILPVYPEENIKMDNLLNSPKSPIATKPKIIKADYNLEDFFDTPTIKQLAQNSFRCHLCTFVADRITALDRHLLNDHEIGLENLLKLVMAKTNEGIINNEDKNINTYYSVQNETFEEGEFVIQTVVPRIIILKHASVNTNLSLSDMPTDREDVEKLEDVIANFDSNKLKINLLDKMQNLDAYIHKLAESTDTLIKAQKKEKLDSKSTVDYPKNASIKEDLLNFGVGDRSNLYDWKDSRECRSRLENLHQSGYIKPKSASSAFHY